MILKSKQNQRSCSSFEMRKLAKETKRRMQNRQTDHAHVISISYFHMIHQFLFRQELIRQAESIFSCHWVTADKFPNASFLVSLSFLSLESSDNVFTSQDSSRLQRAYFPPGIACVGLPCISAPAIPSSGLVPFCGPASAMGSPGSFPFVSPWRKVGLVTTTVDR